MTRTTHKHRSEAQSAKAEEEMGRCTEWLVKFMRNSEPKFLTKKELCRAAVEELKCQRILSTSHGSMQSSKQAATTGINRYVADSTPKIETRGSGSAADCIPLD
jgi:hypothetical protein